MPFSDTHCHLNDPVFDADLDEAIVRAAEANVVKLLIVGFDLRSSYRAVEIASRYEIAYASVGVHPEAAGEWSPAARDEFFALCKFPSHKIVAWGEIGLDYHWESIPRAEQSRVFTEQIESAVALGLPMSVHCRDAYADVIDHLSRFPQCRAALHCFTGSASEAHRAVDMGLYLGVGGIATFNKNDPLRAIVRQCPPDRILLETDSPYLAPQARRGKRNEPSYIPHIASTLAPEFGLTQEELAAQTSANARLLFGW